LAAAPRYTIDASLDPVSGSLAGHLMLRYANTSDQPLSDIVFRLLPNAKTIYGGGSLSVYRVAQGQAALKPELSDDGTILRIPLQGSLAPGQAIWLKLTFAAQIPAQNPQGYGIFSRTADVVSLAGWYPVLAVYDAGWQTPAIPAAGDAMWAETSLYDVRLRVPAGYDVVSTGALVGRVNTMQEVTWHMVSGPAREFAVAISDHFQVAEAEVDGVTLRYHALPAQQSVSSPEDGLGIVTAAFNSYVNRFGPYPFTEFDIVETSVSIDGYEFSGMAFVEHAVRTQEQLADYQYILAHEVAHQWWYGLVGSPTVSEPWLDEALASYSGALYVEDLEGAPEADRMLAAWAAAEGSRRPQDPPLNSSALDFSSWAPYHRIVYTQGALFLDQLRQELGDQQFLALLERYQATYRYRMATTADFLGLAEEQAGRDLSPLFDSWFKPTSSPSPSPR
jgi:hypothetical protein